MAMLHPKRWTQIFPPAPTFGVKDLGLKKGHVFIVTGGNQGVGFELCKMLRGTGATVYIASRSKVSFDAIACLCDLLERLRIADFASTATG